ncbi:MAG: DUF6259 domain-containing protein, partial [Anaerolineae bacterium]|nr:DUF6259 domain-containing protein [Anaerolineae bacterium]
MPTIDLETSNDILKLDSTTGAIVSFGRKSMPGLEFIEALPDTPSFVIQYLDSEQRFRQLTSAQASTITVEQQQLSDTRRQITAEFHHIGEQSLDVSISVEADQSEPLSYWTLQVRNHTDLHITDIQYPFVILRYDLSSVNDETALVWPVGAGRLLQNPQPYELEPDTPHAWQMRPENTAVLHYPGFVTAQFLAYYTQSAGIYMAANDADGYIKLIKPVHHRSGLRLGFDHVGDWPQNGERTLEYAITIGSFVGDWYTAAEIYRSWSAQQHWAEKPLSERDDVPDWLLDSPPHLMVRMQGQLDLGPAEPNMQFLPYPKIIPLLENISQRIESDVVPVIMSWERGGPWVYPDCFPPVGSESLPEFTSLAREHGWHVGTFCNGTRWVTGHYWSGYDGVDYFEEQNAQKGVSRTHQDKLWEEQWDARWRPSYVCCLGAVLTMRTAQDFVQQVIDYGLDWIQFLDQNVGASTFPCYSAEHGHPPAPGHWMTEAMLELTESFHQKKATVAAETNGTRQLVFSVEGPVNEYMIPHFQICDVRVVPPQHEAANEWWKGSIPLYHFLYHEFILIQGGFGHGADPHHLAIKNAFNLVVGEIPGAVLKGDGSLLNKDNPGINWAPWEPQMGDNEESLSMLQSTTAMRRGPGKDYLVFGRMQSPAAVTTQQVEWQQELT